MKIKRYTLFSQCHDNAYMGEHPKGDYVGTRDFKLVLKYLRAVLDEPDNQQRHNDALKVVRKFQ